MKTFVLAVPLILSLCSCTSSSGGGSLKAAAPVAETAPLAPVVKASRADFKNDLTLTAEFEPFQQVDVIAKVTGFVRTIKIDIGDRVRQGQVLTVLEIPEMADDLARAAAAIDQADAEIATASDELHRAEVSHELSHLSYTRIADVVKTDPGLVPQQQVDEAHSRDLVSEAQITTAKSALHTAQQRARVARAERARIETMNKYMTVAAPFDGVVTKRYANEGSMVQSTPVVQLSQNNRLRLSLPVPESAVSRVHVGEAVDVQVSTLNRTFPGRVARFADKIQEATRTMDTEVDVPNPNLDLIPGMYAEVKLRVDERHGVVSVPLDAVDRGGAGTRVYKVANDGTIHVTPVTLGLENEQRVEVVSGVQEGDTVIVGRLAGFRDGQKIRVAERTEEH
ncbi:MAG TPA: efflux RND transporter periplasmic adaptor subunit [Bryobacteraceae bacterium]|jgi:RND family efflux transporter MFP subunit